MGVTFIKKILVGITALAALAGCGNFKTPLVRVEDADGKIITATPTYNTNPGASNTNQTGTPNNAPNGTVVNPTPGQPMAGGVGAGTQVTSSGQVVANPQTAPVQNITATRSGSDLRISFPSLPTFGYQGNIDASLKPYLGINRLGYEIGAGAIEGRWEGNTAVFSLTNVLANDVGNAFFALPGKVGASWLKLDMGNASTSGNVRIVQDRAAPSKYQFEFY